MISLFLRHKLFFILTLSSFLLSGCISGGNTATKFYILNPINSSKSLITVSGQKELLSVEVRSFSLPPYLERPQIVTRTDDNRLRVEEFHYWGGNFRKNIMRVIAMNLSQFLDTPNIVIAPNGFPATPDFRIDVTVMQFERGADNRVYFSAQWQLLCGKVNNVLTSQIINLSRDVNKSTRFEHTVSEMSNIIGEFSNIIGKEIMKQRNGSSNL